MDIDETSMKKKPYPSVWQRLMNSFAAALMGVYIYLQLPTGYLHNLLGNSTIYVVWCLYVLICLLLGWTFGDQLRNFFYVKIMDYWDPRDRF